MLYSVPSSYVGCSMEREDKPLRTWREIAEEASREKDPDRLKKLAEELLEALGQDELQKRRQTA
jgi:hypothetical protein